MLHKFRNHLISPEARILILGTFHPDIDNGADFFYGRPHNFLWHILPLIFERASLKRCTIQQKKEFMSEFKIDFKDIIESLHIIPQGQEDNYEDQFIDQRINDWADINSTIDSLPMLEAVYFTRKSFSKIPNIERKVSIIRNYCSLKCIRFCLLETPSRFYNNEKISKWYETIISKTTCL
ncbi:MAG: hypothetical protein U5K54_28755 [Cytophagales bacterium]|nr:hypothetical protein [Cytophagales bacterium]